VRFGVRTAFTLVELVGVMVILGIIAGAAVPALTGVSRARERADRESAAESIRLARALALASETPHAATFFGSGEAIRIERLSPISGSAEPAVDALSDLVPPIAASADAVTSIGGQAVTARGLRVWFDAEGVPLELGTDPASADAAEEPIVVLFDSGERFEIRAHTGVIQR